MKKRVLSERCQANNKKCLFEQRLMKQLLFVFVFLIQDIGVVLSQPTFDAVSSGTFTTNATATVSHTTGSGNFRFMLVNVSTRNRAVTDVTYGGDPLELVGSNTTNEAFTYMYRMVDPPSGTADVVVTFGSNLSNNNGAVVGVMTFSNVSQSTPNGAYTTANGSNNTATVNVSSNAKQTVVDVVAARQNLTVGAGQNQRWNATAGAETRGGGSTEPGAATTTMSWSLAANSNWSISAVGVNQVANSDLQVTKTVNNSTPYKGQSITFTVTATNNGPDNVPLTVVEDLLPAGLNYVSHTASTGTYNAGSGVWSIGTFNANASATLTITATVLNTSGMITNSASIAGETVDNTSGNNSASATITICQAGGTKPLFNN